ncbi:MAG: hypothetical protein L6R39_002067, partial [Caloplaca ligustica]
GACRVIHVAGSMGIERRDAFIGEPAWQPLPSQLTTASIVAADQSIDRLPLSVRS